MVFAIAIYTMNLWLECQVIHFEFDGNLFVAVVVVVGIREKAGDSCCTKTNP